MIRRPTRPAATAVTLAAALAFTAFAAFAQQSKDTLKFASEMARKGNWREAHFRWGLALRDKPDDFRILNNMAVASEALGEIEDAARYYEQALDAAKNEPRVVDNYRRYSRFVAQRQKRTGEEMPAGFATAVPPSGGKKRGKVELVSVGLPVPPSLALDGIDTLLVASFLTADSALIDTNRDLVRYLRGEFRKSTELEVLEVNPPPAIPEQTIEDLLANAEFWRELSETHGADLIVSGVVRFDREDYSGFRDVDTISERTGQKIRQTRFVEQEKFTYSLDVFFMDGPTGTLLFRDRVDQALLFAGAMNDPITAFYEMSDQIANDVLSVVVHRRRQEPRYVFKK